MKSIINHKTSYLLNQLMCPCGLEHENKENQKMEDAFFIREAFDLSSINWQSKGNYFLIGPHWEANLPTNIVLKVKI